MPSNYAHYRFGQLVKAELPADLHGLLRTCPRAYDVGLHGPDIFFYYDPFAKDNPGSRFHAQTGREFFTRACRHLRLRPSAPGRAYLYGVLGHYCLDSVCHPFVNGIAAEGTIGHIELETEFDRYLLELDGKVPPWAQDTTRHLVLSREESDRIAPFYSGIGSLRLRNSVRRMAFLSQLLIAPGGFKRRLLSKTLPGKHRQFLMTEGPNPNCAHLNKPLLALFEKAQILYPQMVHEITAHLDRNTPFSDLFVPNFG